MQTEGPNQPAADRRGKDRRKAQVSPLPFPDRRQDNRRSGQDRRASPRIG